MEDNGVGFSVTLGQNDEDQTSSARSSMGLSIANKFIAAHGGNLVVHSKPREGTTLSIRLQASHN
ncbi:ATP-binding protein [Paenibacillus hamazuiensis]|uniref:ATP-binding protein n=1 Tax=Paenibacillus hamazuiensis TaxID=2936508 RepID=UPI003084131E